MDLIEFVEDFERKLEKRATPKVGRNDLCPCGPGRSTKIVAERQSKNQE